MLTRDQAGVVNFALSQVVQHGTGTGAAISGGPPIAGKTGTTENYGDAWFVGYTPKLATAVWMGYPEGQARQMTSVHGMKINGGSLPASIFQKFMSKATRDPRYSGGDFPKPDSFPGKVLGQRVAFVEVQTPTSVANAPSTTKPKTSTSAVSAPTAAPAPTPPAPKPTTPPQTMPPPEPPTSRAPPTTRCARCPPSG